MNEVAYPIPSVSCEPESSYSHFLVSLNFAAPKSYIHKYATNDAIEKSLEATL